MEALAKQEKCRMPDQAQPNVFDPEFLQRARKREPPPITGPEATWAGPWKVRSQSGSFFVLRESGGEPEAVTQDHETALLLAAVFPITGRAPLYWLERETVDDKRTIALKTVMGRSGFVTAGRLRAFHRGLVERLSVAEYLLRSPAALVFLLEAAPFETLEQAGAALARQNIESERGASK